MTVYTYLLNNSSLITESHNIKVKSSVSDNSSSSRMTIKYPNECGRNKSLFTVGQDISLAVGQVPTNGIVSYWNFDDEARDQISSNDGTITGAQQVDGIVFNAYSFDGTNDFIDVGNVSELNVGADDFTLSIWFRTTDTSTDAPVNRFLVGKGASGPIRYTLAVIIGSGGNDGRVSINIDDDVASRAVTSATTVNDGEWHHVVAVRDGDNLRLYIDGAEDANSPTDISTTGSLTNNDTFRFGADKNGNNKLNGASDRDWET